MNDFVRTKTAVVTIQENGIIRDSNGKIIATLDTGIELSFVHDTPGVPETQWEYLEEGIFPDTHSTTKVEGEVFSVPVLVTIQCLNDGHRYVDTAMFNLGINLISEDVTLTSSEQLVFQPDYRAFVLSGGDLTITFESPTYTSDGISYVPDPEDKWRVVAWAHLPEAAPYKKVTK